MRNRDLLVMIDDDIDDHQILSLALEELDEPLECIFFFDCESAVAYFKSSPVVAPKYVFLDLNLPRLNGDACLQNLQDLEAFGNPNIVIYSSSIPEHQQSRLRQIGVNKFIEKTASISALVKKIEELVKE